MNTPHLTEFDAYHRTRVIFAAGCIDRLGTLTAECGGSRALLVTDHGIVQAGHVERAIRSLKKAAVEVTIFDQVIENPTTKIVDACVHQARDANIDFIIGLGGGSSMDTAKGSNFLLTNGGKMEDYWGIGKAKAPMLPMIAVPTTTGTGSECQSFALISNTETHAKMACGDPKAAAKIALLDPELTVSQPRHVLVCTGIDAIAHSIESAVCNRRNAVSSLYSHEAYRLCSASFPRILHNAENLGAIGSMQLGAAWAGTAIEQSMLGAAHAMANPLTKRYDLTHGLAVGIVLPFVVRHNGNDRDTCEIYRRLMLQAGQMVEAAPTIAASERLALWLESILAEAGISALIESTRVEKSELTELAQEAAEQWTGKFNPCRVTDEDFVQLYQLALSAAGVLQRHPSTIDDSRPTKCP